MCQGAADLNAALCRWLEQLALFDRAKGYEAAECRSCAHWLNWKCGVALAEAREQVRVARALEELPTLRAAFAAGQLSFSQVRSITRVATPSTEEALVQLARHGTASHLQRVVRAWRRVAAADEAAAADRQYAERFLRWLWDDDGSLVLRGRLPAEDGAAVVAALQAAADGMEPEEDKTSGADRDEAGAPGDDEAAADPAQKAAQRSADALVGLAESFLAHGGESRRAQVVVHVDALTLADDSGERCELDGGPALAAETARRLGCDASVVAIVEGPNGPLDVGRKQRSIPTAMRRALRARDGGCRFPGCTQVRFVDGHHIHHWAQGGPTSLDNLVQLCRRHHRALHEGRWRITVGSGGSGGSGALRFTDPHGRVLETGPVCARGDPSRPVGANRQLGLEIGADTCVPRWAGERMDLGLAIDALVCLSGAPPGD